MAAAGTVAVLLAGSAGAQDDPNQMNPDLPETVCGNTFLEAGEECDPPGLGTADCPSGQTCGATCQCHPRLDHFKCYRVVLKAQRTLNFGIRLEDEFEAREAVVKKGRHFCNPVDKDGEGIADPDSRLLCYALQEKDSRSIAGQRVKKVHVENDFGEWTFRLKPRKHICTPTGTGLTVPHFDHYKCYEVRHFWQRSPKVAVNLADAFETKDALVLKPRTFCNAVDESGEGIINSEDHLTCYELREGLPRRIGDVKQKRLTVINPFGESRLIAASKYPKRLCVRSKIVEAP